MGNIFTSGLKPTKGGAATGFMLKRVNPTAWAAIWVVAGATAAAAVGAAAGSAWAVDVVNADKVPREIVVNDSDGRSRVLTMLPRGKLADVCESCVVLSGNSSIEATGKMIVKVEGGNVSATAK